MFSYSGIDSWNSVITERYLENKGELNNWAYLETSNVQPVNLPNTQLIQNPSIAADFNMDLISDSSNSLNPSFNIEKHTWIEEVKYLDKVEH
jgi:hypothetical protein